MQSIYSCAGASLTLKEPSKLSMAVGVCQAVLHALMVACPTVKVHFNSIQAK